jgi:hypothetical protein
VFLVPQLAGTSNAVQAQLQPLVGAINPTVAYAAERAHVLAFFDLVLKGKTGTGAASNSFQGVQTTSR